jgi:predicted secreted protein
MPSPSESVTVVLQRDEAQALLAYAEEGILVSMPCDDKALAAVAVQRLEDAINADEKKNTGGRIGTVRRWQ